MRPNERLLELVELALSGGDLDSLSDREARRVRELRLVTEAFELGMYAASTPAIERAKQVFEPKPNMFWARLTRSTLGLAGARSAAPSQFQAAFECDIATARLEYTPTPSGWQILGKVDSDGWVVQSNLASVSTEQGRFEIFVNDIQEAEITLTRGDQSWTIPAIDVEATDDSGPSSRRH